MMTEITKHPNPEDPMDQIELLDKYEEGGVAESAGEAFIATISAGLKKKTVNKEGREIWIPDKSKEGEMYLHGDAPGLEEALQRTAYKRLTIALPSNYPSEFIQQRYTRYTATALQMWGDQKRVVVMDQKGNRVVHLAGTPEYQKEIESDKTKVSTSLYFVLADWVEGAIQVTFPDGLGVYRLRTTSRNSLRSIVASLKSISRVTGGKFAGIPLDLWIDFREASDATGARRTIPVWTLRLIPPGGITLTSKSLPGVLLQALEEGQRLALPAVVPEEMEVAEADFVVDVDEDAITDIANGGRCDKAYWTKTWHATVRGTDFEDDDARHRFIRQFTTGKYDSLAAYLSKANEADASSLISAVTDVICDQQESSEPAVDDDWVDPDAGETVKQPEKATPPKQESLPLGEVTDIGALRSIVDKTRLSKKISGAGLREWLNLAYGVNTLAQLDEDGLRDAYRRIRDGEVG